MTYIEEIQKLTEENKDKIFNQYVLTIKSEIHIAASLGKNFIYFPQLDYESTNCIHKVKEYFDSENFKVEFVLHQNIFTPIAVAGKTMFHDKQYLKISW